jgi:sigma-E factor negative regulatory protein RseB
MRLRAALLSSLLVVLALAAQFVHAADAIEWLSRANKAAQQLNYTGTYIYRHGGREEVLRVSHRVDGKQDRQKIEVLDGPHREFIRINDSVYCHLADGKTVRIDKSAAQRFFPAVVPNDPARLNQYYIPKLGGAGKVAGQDCQIVILEPRDQYRYTQMVWIDRATSLPLKSQTLNSRGVPVSTFAFSEIEIGNRPDKALFEVRTAGKRIQVAGDSMGALDDVWSLTPPPGYVRVLESMRPLPGIKTPVLHSIYSDGMSNLSVFIEPILDEDNFGLEGLSTEGAMNVYGRRVEGHKVTTIGEVPPAALLDTANSVHKR